MAVSLPNRVRFGPFELDLKAGEVYAGSDKVRLQEQPFQILLMLLEQKGAVVTRDEIKKRLWPNDTVVEFDHSIHTAIKKLRQALGDSAENPKYIETVARRGYRLLVAVEWLGDAANGGAPNSTVKSTDAAARPNLAGRRVSHYRVLEILGGGGMGVVYKAEDLKLGRQVALKFLPEEMAHDRAAMERFEREARAASALNHPNICTIHGVDEHEGLSFIVMELLEGQTLRDALALSGPNECQAALRIEQVIDMGQQIAKGLTAAHNKGIVHRDVKPANIFVTSYGQVKILDFGLAKLQESEVPEMLSQSPAKTNQESRQDSQFALTRTGVAMGTAGYMSPEQVRGEKLDLRTDLFSFGLVLYEMATGQRAFKGDTLEEVHDSILGMPATPARKLKPQISPQLEHILDRALEKDREKRYQSASDMLVDLNQLRETPQKVSSSPSHRRLARTVGLLLLLAFSAIAGNRYLARRHSGSVTEQDALLLADFVNTTGDPTFDGTLKPALETALRQSPFLNMLSGGKTSSVLAATKAPADTSGIDQTTREICQRAGGKAYVAGSIGSMGQEYVLTLQAVNCQNGETLARRQQVTSGGKDNVLDALGKAAASLRGELGESTASVRQFDVPLSQATTSSFAALKEYSLGNRAGDEKGQAAELPYYLRAIQLDGNFAMAYLDAGKDFLNAGQSERGAEYIAKAYELRDRVDTREKQEIASVYFLIVTGELDKAANAYEQMIAAYPRTASAYSGLGLLYAEQGRYEEAAATNRRLTALKPDISGPYENLALNLLALQRFDDVRQTAHAESARKLDTYALHKGLYALAFVTGDKSSMDEQEAWFRKNPTFTSLGEYLQGETDGYAGRLRKAQQVTHKLVNDILLHSESGGQEGAAKQLNNAALREAMFGNTSEARRAAMEAVRISPTSQRVELESALALAMVGDTARAQALAQDVNKRFPLHTQVQNLWLPTIDAQVMLAQKKSAAAINRLKPALNTELGFTPTHVNTSCLYAPYVRGQAYLASKDGGAAATEFQKIIDHSGIVWNCATGALAHLGLARANAIQSQTDTGVAADAARARAFAAYKDFFELWKDADPNIPILRQAKTEYTYLRSMLRTQSESRLSRRP